MDRLFTICYAPVCLLWLVVMMRHPGLLPARLRILFTFAGFTVVMLMVPLVRRRNGARRTAARAWAADGGRPAAGCSHGCAACPLGLRTGVLLAVANCAEGRGRDRGGRGWGGGEERQGVC